MKTRVHNPVAQPARLHYCYRWLWRLERPKESDKQFFQRSQSHYRIMIKLVVRCFIKSESPMHFQSSRSIRASLFHGSDKPAPIFPWWFLYQNWYTGNFLPEIFFNANTPCTFFFIYWRGETSLCSYNPHRTARLLCVRNLAWTVLCVARTVYKLLARANP